MSYVLWYDSVNNFSLPRPQYQRLVHNAQQGLNGVIYTSVVFQIFEVNFANSPNVIPKSDGILKVTGIFEPTEMLFFKGRALPIDSNGVTTIFCPIPEPRFYNLNVYWMPTLHGMRKDLRIYIWGWTN